MNFSEMTAKEAANVIRECEYMHKIPKENVIHICSIPNERYASCNRYIAKCKDGVVDFLATEHYGSNVDELINIVRVLDSKNGKKDIETEIKRIEEQTRLRIQHEQKILRYL